MSEWKEYRLDELVKFSSGGTPSKSKEEYWDGDIPWISASSMNGYEYSDSKLKVTKEGLLNGTRLAPENALLLLVRGSILHQKIQVGITTKEVSFNQDVKCLIVDKAIIEPWYLLFWFKAQENDLLAKVESTGIGAGKLDTSVLQNLTVQVPPKSERIVLTRIFRNLQKKIELNRKLNQTLEEMAQALFQSWFVDFDPVLDNAIAAGNEIPEALQVKAAKRNLVAEDKKLLNVNPELAEKFPNSFVFDEELAKWIPEGWEVKKLEQLIKHQKGYAFKSSWYQKEGHIVVRVSDTTESSIDVNSCNKISNELALEYSSYALEENDLVIATVGSWPPNYSSVVGKVIRVPRTAVGGLLNQNAVKLTVSDEYLFHQGFLHFNLKNSRFMDYIINRAQGSANQASITLKSIFNYTVLLANDDVMNAFSKQVAKSFDKQNSNQKQTSTLTKLRDTLLPQLISGKLRVPEAMLKIQETTA